MGLLNFLSKAILPGRAFTRRIYCKFAGEKLKQHHHVKVDDELRSHCMVWLHFLLDQESVSRPFIDFTQTLRADKINFFTDASGAENLGFGAIFGENWTFHRWDPGFIANCKPSIEFLELYVLTIAIDLWADKLRNRRVVVFCDNKSVVGMINKTASPCMHCMKLIQIITLKSLICNVRFFADYVSTKDNFLADALSRMDLKRFWKRITHKVNANLTPIPRELWPAL